jgi:hypothetical protein
VNKRVRSKTIRLRRLWYRCRGRCQSCGCETGLVHRLVPEGWIHLQEGFLVNPLDGTVLRVATVEHLMPRARGGPNDQWNLTLYCQECNQKTSGWGSLRGLDSEAESASEHAGH